MGPRQLDAPCFPVSVGTKIPIVNTVGLWQNTNRGSFHKGKLQKVILVIFYCELCYILYYISFWSSLQGIQDGMHTLSPNPFFFFQRSCGVCQLRIAPKLAMAVNVLGFPCLVRFVHRSFDVCHDLNSDHNPGGGGRGRRFLTLFSPPWCRFNMSCYCRRYSLGLKSPWMNLI